MDMMEERDKRWSYGITLPAVARATDEKHLSAAEAMKLLRDMLGPGEQPRAVMKSIRRLERIDDEGNFDSCSDRSRLVRSIFKGDCLVPSALVTRSIRSRSSWLSYRLAALTRTSTTPAEEKRLIQKSIAAAPLRLIM